jgi:hypothetical protein
MLSEVNLFFQQMVLVVMFEQLSNLILKHY